MPTAATAPQPSEAESKDGFFAELSDIAERMSAAHGREFAMGAFILAARFLAENRAGTLRNEPTGTN